MSASAEEMAEAVERAQRMIKSWPRAFQPAVVTAKQVKPRPAPRKKEV